ncbi:hypothetical protein ACLOJK_022949 [Asimina triloba]
MLACSRCRRPDACLPSARLHRRPPLCPTPTPSSPLPSPARCPTPVAASSPPSAYCPHRPSTATIAWPESAARPGKHASG